MPPEDSSSSPCFLPGAGEGALRVPDPNSSDSNNSSPSTTPLTGTKGGGAATTLLVNRPRDQVLAGARLAFDDDWERRADDAGDLLRQVPHRRAVAGKPRHATRFTAVAFRLVGVVLLQPASL